MTGDARPYKMPLMASVMTRNVSGLDLLMRRRTAALRQEDIALCMGVNRSRVAHLESQYRPSREAVRRYMAAVAEIAGR